MGEQNFCSALFQDHHVLHSGTHRHLILDYIVLYYITLYDIILYVITVYYIALYCIKSYCIILYSHSLSILT